MARTLFTGPYMYHQHKKTEVRWCSPVTRPLEVYEISERLLMYFYRETQSALVNAGTSNQTLRCRAEECKGTSKTSMGAVYFIEMTRDVYAGPLCLPCVEDHLKHMARTSGETRDTPIYKVLTTKQALDRITSSVLKGDGSSRPPMCLDPSVRMF